MEKPIEAIINPGDIDRVSPFGHSLGFALRAYEQKNMQNINRLDELIYSVPPRNAKVIRKQIFEFQIDLTENLPRQ